MNTIREIQRLSALRAARWHQGKPNWSILEWSGAMNGEGGEAIGAVLELLLEMIRHAGEAANAAKKIKRLEEGLANITPRDAKMVEAKLSVGKEVADVVLYAMCLCEAAGIDLEAMIVEVFNQKSDEYGFPEHLEYRSS